MAAALLFPILSLSASAATDEARASAPKAIAAAAPAALPSSLRPVSAEAALDINRSIPFSNAPNVPALPFVLAGDDVARAHALECLTAAVYYEAGQESEAGKEAVAQVVLNRVRHPAYPASVCGVVFEGSTQPPGCQFTFTCDGSLIRPPDSGAWAQSAKVAGEALAGKVFAPVGLSTHYHADYVVPYWATSLAKVAQVGAHIFYRWPGMWGQPNSFRERYAGKESDPSVLRAAALMTAGLWPRDLGPARAGVDLKADPQLQLLGVVRLLANREGSSPNFYETEIRTYFAGASDTPAVQLLRDAQSDGTAGDADKFADAVRAFGESNDWKSFFRAHRRFYDQTISRAESKLGAAVAAWDAYTGTPVKTSVIAAAVGPGGNLPVCLASKSRPIRELWIPTGGEVRGAADIFLASGVPTGILEQGAAGGDSGFEAQVIRAVFIRIEALSSGEAAGEKAVSREIGLGHALVPEIARRLTFYEHHRAEFPTLASFLPQLLKGLPTVSDRLNPVEAMDCKPAASAEIASVAGGPSRAGAGQGPSRIRIDAAARVRETL
ncbi:MAG TPA: cell wall hydrolase [Sphingomicrobium sp.]|nr:cell wall hydrolase [Sphingomicrobium sp.]